MRKLGLILITLAFCYMLANIMVNDSGYVLVAYDRMTFESSIWGMLLLISIIIVFLKGSVSCLRLLLGASTIIYPWSDSARKKQAQRMSNKGLAEFTYGHWKKAEKLLAQAAKNGESPLINYLAAARAAHECGNTEASSEYLRHADHKAPGAEIAIGITQAQLQLSGGHLEQALATLTHLHKKAPNHIYILKLLKQSYILLNDWHAIVRLLPQLKKYKIIDENQYRNLEKQAFEALFEQAYKQGRSQNSISQKIQPAHNVWNSLTSQQRKNTSILFRYTHCLARLGAEDKAERLLRENLNKYYSHSLIRLYGQVKGIDTNKQLLTAESLLSERTNDPELLLALGRLSLHNDLWGKAREYFETSLRLRKSVEVYNEMGRLLAQLNEHEKSTDFFRSGLNLATDRLLPLPEESLTITKYKLPHF